MPGLDLDRSIGGTRKILLRRVLVAVRRSYWYTVLGSKMKIALSSKTKSSRVGIPTALIDFTQTQSDALHCVCLALTLSRDGYNTSPGNVTRGAGRAQPEAGAAGSLPSHATVGRGAGQTTRDRPPRRPYGAD